MIERTPTKVPWRVIRVAIALAACGTSASIAIAGERGSLPGQQLFTALLIMLGVAFVYLFAGACRLLIWRARWDRKSPANISMNVWLAAGSVCLIVAVLAQSQGSVGDTLDLPPDQRLSALYEHLGTRLLLLAAAMSLIGNGFFSLKLPRNDSA